VNFAREGLSFIAIAAFIAVGAFGVALARRSWPLWLLAFALTLIALWVAYFFRDPQRLGERGERLVIAPADGKIVMITEVDEPTFMKQRAIRISIFMNVFNVHVNRYPVSGFVRLVDRKPGAFSTPPPKMRAWRTSRRRLVSRPDRITFSCSRSPA
jgi:phosphatidylserine decarboxylase